MGKFFKKLFGRPSKGMEPLRQQKDLPSVTPSDCVEISYRHIDTDEGVPTPKGTVLSYLDAGALKFWNGKTTDYEIPEYYRTTAFGRNVLPAKDRLLENCPISTCQPCRKRIENNGKESGISTTFAGLYIGRRTGRAVSCR